MKTSLQLSAIGLMACSLFLSTRLQATPVTGPWANAAGQGDGPILNGNTASPTVGDGSANSADGEMVHSPFSAITLANSGDKIVFTGSVTLIGTVNSPLTSGIRARSSASACLATTATATRWSGLATP